MKRASRLLLLAVAALGVIAIAGCGGDDDGGSDVVTEPTETEPVQLTKDEFIEQGDAICEEANTAVASLAAVEGGGQAVQISQERDITGGMLERLEALGTPMEDEQTLDGFRSALNDLLDNLDKQELAAERDDSAGLAELQAEESSIRTELTAAAEDYGFKQCGQEGEAPTPTEEGPTGGAQAPAPAPAAPAPAPAPATPAPAPPSGGTGGATGGAGGGGGGMGGSGGVSP